MRKAETLLTWDKPGFHIPAPIYNQLKQVTQSWIVSPSSLRGRWQNWRPEWPENPYHPRFILTFSIILMGITTSLFGLGGKLTPPPMTITAEGTALPAPANDIETVEGQSERMIRSSFGAPSLIRREPPAEIWQYRSSTCVLDLYLYPTAEGRSVSHAEMRPRQSEPTAPEFKARCLASLSAAAQ